MQSLSQYSSIELEEQLTDISNVDEDLTIAVVSDQTEAILETEECLSQITSAHIQLNYLLTAESMCLVVRDGLIAGDTTPYTWYNKIFDTGLSLDISPSAGLEGIGEVLSKIFKAIANFFKKIWNWFIGLFKKSKVTDAAKAEANKKESVGIKEHLEKYRTNKLKPYDKDATPEADVVYVHGFKINGKTNENFKIPSTSFIQKFTTSIQIVNKFSDELLKSLALGSDRLGKLISQFESNFKDHPENFVGGISDCTGEIRAISKKIAEFGSIFNKLNLSTLRINTVPDKAIEDDVASFELRGDNLEDLFGKIDSISLKTLNENVETGLKFYIGYITEKIKTCDEYDKLLIDRASQRNREEKDVLDNIKTLAEVTEKLKVTGTNIDPNYHKEIQVIRNFSKYLTKISFDLNKFWEDFDKIKNKAVPYVGIITGKDKKKEKED